MLVREVMTTPAVTVRVDATTAEAIKLLDAHRVTMLPVVSPAGVVVGVLSEADVVRDALPPDFRSHLIPTGELETITREASELVAELMTLHPMTVREDVDLAEAAGLMTETSVKSLPVVDDDGVVVGVVSRGDIVHLLARPDEAVEAELDDLLRRLGTDWLVDVVGGAATVAGPVGAHETAMAENAALSIPGVRSVRVVAG